MTLSITTLDALHQMIAEWWQAGDTIAFVPTMGALHEGHLALVEAAKREAKRVVVSIFVNPTQFAPHEDFSRYPRPLEKDLALLQRVGVDVAWLPSVTTMYPDRAHATIHIDGISEILEGAFRPGHFDGVATVVSRLFSQVTPNIAVFGEKDYQQLCLIKRLVKIMHPDIQVLGVPTVRETDGLAMSSRNQYLSETERAIAPHLYAALQAATTRIKAGEAVAGVLNEAKTNIIAAGFRSVDYIALATEDTCEPLTRYVSPARLLAAVHLGTTRLIDNVVVE